MKHKLIAVFFAVILAAGCAFGLSACDGLGGSSSDGGTSSGNGGSSQSGSSSGSSSTNTYLGIPKPVTFNVRETTVTITDSGRENQQIDKVPFSDHYKASALNNAGYTKLKVTLTIDVKEENDGYQYIFLYYNSKCKGNNLLDKLVDIVYDEDPSLLHYWKFEHGAGKKNTSWKTYTFNTSLKMSSIKDDIYIRYGASGSGEDDWRNKNVTVTLEPLKP